MKLIKHCSCTIVVFLSILSCSLDTVVSFAEDVKKTEKPKRFSNIEEAIEGLDSKNCERRKRAIGFLAGRKYSPAVDLIVERLLKDPEPSVRVTAAWGLQQFGVLLFNMLMGRKPIPKISSFPHISDEQRKRVIKALMQALSDKNDNVRVQSCFALGEFQAEEALPLLLKLLRQDSFSEVRMKAADNIAIINPEPSPEILKVLKQAMDQKYEEDFMTRLAAEKAFERLTGTYEFAEPEEKKEEPEPPSEEAKKVEGKLMQTFYKERDYEKAETEALELLKLHSSNELAHFALGYVNLLKDDYKKAIEYLEKVKRSEKYCFYAREYLGLAYFDLGDYDEAFSYFLPLGYAVASLDDESATGRISYEVAMTCAALGKTKDALAWLESASNINIEYINIALEDLAFDKIKDSTEFQELLKKKKKSATD